MTDKELKKLSRAELLEMLLEQSKELELTKQQLEIANKRLEERTIVLKQSGNIAEAALRLNGIFEAAQKAADDYIESIKSVNA